MYSFWCRRKYLSHALLPLLALAAGVTPSCKRSENKREPFGGELPRSASDIQEQQIDMFPDWEYYVRARMPIQDCGALLAKVASQENLLPVATHRWLDGKGDWGPASPPMWWHPTWPGSHHHGRQGDVNTCAMCVDGIFYYWSGSH